MSDAWQNWPPSDHDLDELSIPTDDINDVDDCTEVYDEPIDDASIFVHLDEFNNCRDPVGTCGSRRTATCAASIAMCRRCR